ncbi:MAG: hypothetical protein ABR881_11670 [Candidatus Sulfotelmatobacter sp.]
MPQLKPLLADTISKVDGVLFTPVPEALVIDLGDPDGDAVNLQLTWWTKSPRQHEMVASHDRVLTAIRQALQQLASKQRQTAKPRALKSITPRSLCVAWVESLNFSDDTAAE